MQEAVDHSLEAANLLGDLAGKAGDVEALMAAQRAKEAADLARRRELLLKRRRNKKTAQAEEERLQQLREGPSTLTSV